MNFIHWCKSIAATLIMILLVFVAASLFDVFVAVISIRFYTTAAFITIFGVGGIFAGCLGYYSGITKAPQKNESARWSVIVLIIFAGLLFFFLLAPLEGGEYKVPFKAFGVTTALASLFFAKGKIEL